MEDNQGLGVKPSSVLQNQIIGNGVSRPFHTFAFAGLVDIFRTTGWKIRLLFYNHINSQPPTKEV